MTTAELREIEQQILQRRPEHSINPSLDRIRELTGLLGGSSGQPDRCLYASRMPAMALLYAGLAHLVRSTPGGGAAGRLSGALIVRLLGVNVRFGFAVIV